MPTPRGKPDAARLDKLVADARRNREQREAGYRERALKIYPWICGRCTREFTRENVQQLTVHHRDHNHDNNPPDGSNWELLCLYCHDNEHSRAARAGRPRPGGAGLAGRRGDAPPVRGPGVAAEAREGRRAVSLLPGVLYFILVFGAGFILGPIRVLWLVPRLGERWAELVELPVMVVVIVLAARFVVRRLAVPPTPRARLLMGALGLALTLAAECALAHVAARHDAGRLRRQPRSGVGHRVLRDAAVVRRVAAAAGTAPMNEAGAATLAVLRAGR